MPIWPHSQIVLLWSVKIDETAKLVGLLKDLSTRLKKLETATAAEKKRNSGRGRANNRTHSQIMLRTVQIIIMHLSPHSFQTLRPQSLFLTNKVILTVTSKIFVHTYRRRTHSKIMLRTVSIRLLHLFATLTKLSVTRHARAETLAHFLSNC